MRIKSMKYSPKYFWKDMPKWKKKKDPIMCRLFIRPLSFLFSSICTNIGMSANLVSWLNTFTAVAAAVMFFLPGWGFALTGAILAFVWLLFDCVDGNMARSVKKQPYGEFADAMSSYLLVPLLCFGLGFYTYQYGGFFFDPGNIWIFVVAMIAGFADTMMRLIYQKYKSVTLHMIEMGVVEKLEDKRNDHSKVGSFRVRMESEMGIAGVVPVLTLLGVIFGFTDITIFYCFVYFGGACGVSTLMWIWKSLKYRHASFKDPEDKDVAVTQETVN